MEMHTYIDAQLPEQAQPATRLDSVVDVCNDLEPRLAILFFAHPHSPGHTWRVS